MYAKSTYTLAFFLLLCQPYQHLLANVERGSGGLDRAEEGHVIRVHDMRPTPDKDACVQVPPGKEASTTGATRASEVD